MSEYFDQNPISQLAILVTREGQAERISPLSGAFLASGVWLGLTTRAGNPVDHIKALQNKKKLEARGEPSLQNVMEMARAGLA